MAAPLPQTLIDKMPAGRARAGNYGLLFNRYFDQYDSSFSSVPDAGKSNFLNTMVAGGGKCGDKDAIDQAVKQQLQLTHAFQGSNVCYQCDWHFVTGMGNEHPVENGFTWHHTLGTPYIPGSTVKGLVRAWMEQFSDQSDSERQHWFGNIHKKDSDPDDNQAGALIFMDAIPVEPPELAIDIMTPHMGKWYENGGDPSKVTKSDALPGDWHSPVPVPFLVTRKASLLFSISARPGSNIALEPVLEALESALAWLGVGSKTAIGYGHMTLNDTPIQRIRQAINVEAEAAIEKLADSQLSEQLRILKNVRKQFDEEQSQGKNPGAPSRDQLRELSEADFAHWSQKDKTTLLALAEDILKFHGNDSWKKPTKADKRNQRQSLWQQLSEKLL
tara:strand:- start:250 stop:1413 length:1164 start_codon:yes stop_codon:yes gene_type:complete